MIVIAWFKTIFILEITGQIVLKLVPEKFKTSIAFVMKLVLIIAVIAPLLRLNPDDIDKIFSDIKADYNNYASEEAMQYDNEKVIINDCIRRDIEAEASEYGIKIISVECDTDMVEGQIVIRKIIFRVKCDENSSNPAGFKTFAALKYNLDAGNVYLKEV